MSAASNFDKAARQFGNYQASSKSLTLIPEGTRLLFKDHGDHIKCTSGSELVYDEMPVTDATTVGDICKFIAMTLELVKREGLEPPEKLKGTGTGGFEDLITQEGNRLEKLDLLTLGRYPVASVIIQGSSRPMQVPSLPDFEGVLPPDGSQFVFEAKVCTQSAFEIVKDKVKPKQIKHMLKRYKFGVPGWLLIHFNAREGKTFYDPAFTVAIPIKPADHGGLPVWEKFAADKKGAYAGSIDREEARKIGTLVPWHIPKRCTTVRPDLSRFLLPYVATLGF